MSACPKIRLQIDIRSRGNVGFPIFTCPERVLLFGARFIATISFFIFYVIVHMQTTPFPSNPYMRTDIWHQNAKQEVSERDIPGRSSRKL
jgi:hypothetical protein